MSRKPIRWEPGMCHRCWFHGIRREATTSSLLDAPGQRNYCRECADRIARKEAETRHRLENRPPPQITHYDKEAT